MGEVADAEADDIGALPPGAAIGGYTVRRMLGHGGFGITYEAYNSVTGKHVAIKEFFPSSMVKRDSASRLTYAKANAETITWALRKFQETTTTLCGLSHPHIVQVHDYLPANDTGYMVMELLDGQTLGRWLAARTSPPGLDELWPLLDPVMEALTYVHGRGLIHRDIAPDNIVITREGRPVLIDFGSVSRDLGDARQQAVSSTVGMKKRHYTAPEQMLAKARPTAKADVYSMGAVLYRALTGVEPADGLDRVLSKADPLKPLMGTRSGRCSTRAAQAVDKALAVSPEKRLEAIAELREAVRPPPPLREAEPIFRARSILIGAIVAVLAAAGGVAAGRWWPAAEGAGGQRHEIEAAKAEIEGQRRALLDTKADLDRQSRQNQVDKASDDVLKTTLDAENSRIQADKAGIEAEKAALKQAGRVADTSKSDSGGATAETKKLESDKAAAVGGDVKAMYQLGIDYDLRTSIAQIDRAEARKWYEKAAASGNAEAMVALGLDYHLGIGGVQDRAEARKWLEKAVDAGSVDAMLQLGLGFGDTDTASADRAASHEWFEKAAVAGNTIAMVFVGEDYGKGRGVRQNYLTARGWYEKAAAAGDATAMFNLGSLYASGAGVSQDYGKAREWYEKAAARGNTDGMNSLGFFYDRGLGVEQDPVKAREWYDNAAVRGDANAMANLGVLYRDGRGGVKDYDKARDFFLRAIAGGKVPSAMTGLGALYNDGQGVAQDFAQAREWYEKGAAGGDAWAMYNLGHLYEKGLGVAADRAKAREWYGKAAAAGNAEAKTALQRL